MISAGSPTLAASRNAVPSASNWLRCELVHRPTSQRCAIQLEFRSPARCRRRSRAEIDCLPLTCLTRRKAAERRQGDEEDFAFELPGSILRVPKFLQRHRTSGAPAPGMAGSGGCRSAARRRSVLCRHLGSPARQCGQHRLRRRHDRAGDGAAANRARAWHLRARRRPGDRHRRHGLCRQLPRRVAGDSIGWQPGLEADAAPRPVDHRVAGDRRRWFDLRGRDCVAADQGSRRRW